MNVSLEISFNFTFCRFIEEGYGQKMIVYCSSYCVLKSNTDESTFVFCECCGPVVQEQAPTCFKLPKVLIRNTAYLQMFLLYGGRVEVDLTAYLH